MMQALLSEKGSRLLWLIGRTPMSHLLQSLSISWPRNARLIYRRFLTRPQLLTRVSAVS
jgi:hypothetical protein